MKKAGLALLFLVCFVAVDGFCRGKKDPVQVGLAQIGFVQIGTAQTFPLPPEPDPPLPPQIISEDSLVPITKEIIDFIGEDNLKKLGYYLSMPMNLITNNHESIPRIDSTGKIIQEWKNISKEFPITTTDKGELKAYSPNGKAFFEVFFLNDNGITFRFERNEEKNSFDLVSIEEKGGKISAIRGSEQDPVFQLCVYFNTRIDPDANATFKIQGTSAQEILRLEKELESLRLENDRLKKQYEENRTRNISLEEQLDDIKRQKNIENIEIAELKSVNSVLQKKVDASNSHVENLIKEFNDRRTRSEQNEMELLAAGYKINELRKELDTAYSEITDLQRKLRIAESRTTVNTPIDRTNARRIEGTGSLTKNNVVAYIRAKNSKATNVEVLVEAYIREAQREGINYDIAIAQMCHATEFLQNQRLLNNHNYAGFGAIQGNPVTYSNRTEGVRAHIQHLKGYASMELPKDNIDKRFQILVDSRVQGTVKTLDALFVKWAPTNSQEYSRKINGILDELYAF